MIYSTTENQKITLVMFNIVFRKISNLGAFSHISYFKHASSSPIFLLFSEMKNIKTNEYQTRMILYGIFYHGDKNSNRFLGFEKISSFSLFFLYQKETYLWIFLHPTYQNALYLIMRLKVLVVLTT